MNDVKSYKSCKWCGVSLSRVTWLNVFCSETCMQGCTEYKQQAAPKTPLAVYLDQIAGNCLKGKRHPNKNHTSNNLLEPIRSKINEIKELFNLRNQQLLNT